MKILYVTALNETINAFLIPHIEMLVNEENQVDCACNINMDIDKRLKECGVNYYNINFSRNPIKINYLNVISQVKKIYKKNNYDIVHVHTPIASFLTRFALRKYNVKIIYTAHGFHFFKGAPILNWLLYYPLERIAAHWTDKLVTINTEDYERSKTFKLRNDGQVELMHGVGINPNEYKLDDFNREEYRKDLGINPEDFMLLILADINKNKNHIQVIKAINNLKNDYSNIKVICAGEGPLKDRLIKKVQELGLEENIKFIGFRTDVSELVNCCDCLGLFSRREGLGKCILEGMIDKKAVIATNTRGPRELIVNGINGFLVDVGEWRKTAQCLKELYLDKHKCKKFGDVSRKKVKRYYMKNVLNEIKTYY